jgi:hypothetical protein
MRICLFILCFCCILDLSAKAGNKLSANTYWTFQANKINDTTFDLVFNIELAADQKLWSNSNNIYDSMVSPSFTFDNNTKVKFVGAIRHKGAHTVTLSDKDPRNSYYIGSVCFYQKVKVLQNTSLKGQLGFQIGNKKYNGSPQTIDFTFKLGNT